MKMFLLILFGLFASALAQSKFYDTFTGKTLSPEEVKGHIKKNNTVWCVKEVLPCDPLECRRVDGTCNNLKHPSRGAPHTPVYRLLPAKYDKGFEPRTDKCGGPLPNARKLRYSLLPEGEVPDALNTQMLLYFWVFTVSDVLSIHDTVNYILWTTTCCQEKGKSDKACIPIRVSDDDPVHRFSSVRCLNLTRPISFQSVGCLRNDTSPERIISATPLFDLSQVYGGTLQALNEKGRLFEKGLLKFEIFKGNVWPPKMNATNDVCLQNQLPYETRCHDLPEPPGNSVLGLNLFVIWSWRLHNRIATSLGYLNPCWDDDKLFYVTRDIVIAIMMQINFYELLPALLGYENLLSDGVLLPHDGFRDLYDETVLPQISLEFPFALRWAHTAQEGNLKMYDRNGHYMKSTRMVKTTLRTGYLADNLEYITHGAFRQPCANFDYVVHPDLAETIVGTLQVASDVFASDLTKNRFFGFPPYVDYLKFCSGKSYCTFEDLLDIIDPERVEMLKNNYKNIEDIDLLAGMWLEKHIPGGRVPYTLYCVYVKQLLRTIISDRHWYERPNRPNAFTFEQLLEIRKATVAQVLCAVGDNVTRIQPRAFFLPGPENEICSCDNIEKINLMAWKDDRCDAAPGDDYDYTSCMI